ncbi:restriction endonuclease subunit S [Klebsiella pneumoniae]|uniref:restriction endonuclease subunit S n=1 Tax=Klebsiella pneumoniae TaxID=573 RepID=UPI000D36DD58|nr:restriction endonuclease subunit S [Klebsiella pneumoniae]HDS6866872.1 restriction endonuclease subunit S [Klebsiella pneumoniae subsp. pneumoniae]AZQ32065.1 restriction endonuclease subunit S [Klebsiella pneumoniae]VGC01995.1 restriction modification system DNA specificity domain-containing protein [Klebsiella pneumoniae]HBR4205471.1 restriction endonuclease subunit S [Klebsiella pneumoniae]HBV3129583.1 restriction endonuclease subunit S [Klebsiella pneumoniae]
MTTIFKRTPEQLSERRIDPWHYQPRFEIQINKIKDNLGALPLEAVIDSKRGVASGATPLGANYLEKGRVKFYRTSEVEEMFLQAEEAVFINDEDDEKLKRSRLVDGDVLLTITGAKFGKSAVVSAKHLPANISQHSVRFKPDPKKVDAHFLVAYLNSKTGQVAIWKEAYGATRPAIDFPSVRSLAVPKVLPLAQKYIGDKVRQAEQLRAWAKRLYRIPAFIDAFIQGALPLSLTDSLFSLMKNSNNDAIKELTKFLALNIEDAQMKQNFQDFIEKNKMGSVDIEREFSHINTVSTLAIEDFLSAQTYRPAITDAFDKITSKKFSTLQSISLEPIRQGATPKFSTIGKKCIKSKQTRDLFLDETGYEVVDPNDEQNKRIVRLKRNDILVTRQGAGTVGRASIFLDDEETYITDSLFLVRIDPAKANPAFVAGFLRSYTGQRLIEKGVYGSTGQLNLSSTALRNIPILDVPLEFQNFLGETLCTADTLFKLSTRLTQSAKTLVEALIEGQLTEKQLIQAQQALEDGNNSLDQTIISKLSAEGYAIEGATPLFSDVDELYSLLENAAQAEAEE